MLCVLVLIMTLFELMSSSRDGEAQMWKHFLCNISLEKPSRILDFSYSSYRHGTSTVPEVAEPFFLVADFGANSISSKSSAPVIQRATDECEAAGAGVILSPFFEAK
jgi:hypothetical protein